MNPIQTIIVDIEGDVAEGLDHPVQILVTHHLIEEDHLNIQSLNVDIGPIPEAEAGIEIVVRKVIKVQGIAIQKVEKDTSIVPDHVLQIVQKGRLDLLPGKSLEVDRAVLSLM